MFNLYGKVGGGKTLDPICHTFCSRPVATIKCTCTSPRSVACALVVQERALVMGLAWRASWGLSLALLAAQLPERSFSTGCYGILQFKAKCPLHSS